MDEELAIESEIKLTAKHVIISMNPNSGASDRRSVVLELESRLQAKGMEVEVLTDIDKVKALVEELSFGETGSSQLRAVVAAGGDGTVSLLANSLPPQTPLAILPLGTENLLAKYLDLTADPEMICDMIVSGKTARLDAGRANGQLFLVMASCGFDAEVVRRLHSQRRGHIHHWSYAVPILESIRRYRYPKIWITLDDGEERISGKWAFIFNVPRYAMNLPIVSDADPTDGLLDICTFRGGNLFRGLFYLTGILLRRHRLLRDTHFARFSRIRIESSDRVPYQLDGDPGGELPLEIEVIPQFLRVLVKT